MDIKMNYELNTIKTNNIKINFKKLNEGAIVPGYQTESAACCDLHSLEEVRIGPGDSKTIGTGLAIEIPHGYEGIIRSRSGLAAKYGIHVLNSPATIDFDYRGEIKVILHNTSMEAFNIKTGDRIAQFTVKPIWNIDWNEVENLSSTDRGTGGLGSTGR